MIASWACVFSFLYQPIQLVGMQDGLDGEGAEKKETGFRESRNSQR